MGNNTLLGMSWNLLCFQPCTVYRVVVSQGECCNNGEKALQRSTVTLQAQNIAHHEDIFQLQMWFVPNFKRLYQSLQLYWHFKQSVDATSTLPLTNTHTHAHTHTHSYVTHSCQACIHIVPNITAYFQAETFCLLRYESYELFKIDLWNSQAVCVQRKPHKSIYVFVFVDTCESIEYCKCNARYLSDSPALADRTNICCFFFEIYPIYQRSVE